MLIFSSTQRPSYDQRGRPTPPPLQHHVQRTRVTLGLTPVDSDVHCHADLRCRGSGGQPVDAGDCVPVVGGGILLS